MIKTAFIGIAALALLSTASFAASTDGSRSDSTFIRNPDLSAKGPHWDGDTHTSRSGSRSDSTFIPAYNNGDAATNHALHVRALKESGYDIRYDHVGGILTNHISEGR